MAAKAEVKGSMAVLPIEQKVKEKEGYVTTETTVYMVKEDGQWKIGSPEDAK
jgi:hypothetical protein